MIKYPPQDFWKDIDMIKSLKHIQVEVTEGELAIIFGTILFGDFMKDMSEVLKEFKANPPARAGRY